MAEKKTVIIGAGLGGLAAAALLASEGRRVVVCERNLTPGGKMQEFRSAGFRFDTGPSLLTLPEIIQELFRRCNDDARRHLEWVSPEPVCRYVFSDGTTFSNHADRQRSMEEIARFAPEDRQAYSRFLDYAGDLYKKTSGPFLFNPLCDLQDFRNLKWLDLFHIDALRTVSSRIDRTFRSEYMRTFFKRFPTYTGSSPFLAPATLNTIPYVELVRGGYHLKGGMYRLAEALEKLAARHGAEFQYGTSVRRIEIHKGTVCGVRIEKNGSPDEEFIEGIRVLSNADAAETLLNLIDPQQISRYRKWRLRRRDPSLSAFVMMLGTDRTWSELRHHNLFFSADYRKEFRQLMEEERMPDDPSLYVSNTSRSDPRDAPAGGSNLFILANAPPLADGDMDAGPGSRRSSHDLLSGEETVSWPEMKIGGVPQEEIASRILKKLERSGLEGLSGSIQVQKILTPSHFQDAYRADRGSIYGRSSNSRLSAFLRPRNRFRHIRGLYLTGGSTHPGGGIPLVLLSAMHAVELIRRDERRPGR